MLTLTRQGLLLSLSATVIPSQGSSDVPVAVVNDINTYVGYTLEPRVGYYLNGIYKSTVCPYDTSAKTFSVPAEAFKQIGIIDITLALIDNANANHIETCQTVHATVNKAPLGTVVLPDQTTWQDYVNSYMNQLFDSNYKPQFDQIQQDLENLVTEAQQQQQTAEQQQTQINNAISVMGEYQIVSNDPVQIQFKQGDGTFGPTVDLGDGLASKSMVNAGFYQSIGSQYSGAASDYGIEVAQIIGAYEQEGTPTPESPIEPKFFEPKNGYSVGKNMFDKDNVVANNRVSGEDGTFLSQTGTYRTDYIDINSDFVSIFISGNKTSQTATSEVLAWYNNEKNFISGERMKRNGVFPNKSYEIPSNASYVIFNFRNEDIDEIQLSYGSTEQPYTPFVGQSTTPLNITLRALPNGVCDTYENGVITRRVGVVEFDGSADESWAKNSGTDYTYQITLPDISLVEVSDGNDILSDRFIAKMSNATLSSGEFRRGGGNTVGNNILVFHYDGLTTDDLNAWERWLASNPVTIWYELATPTTEAFEIPRLQSFYPFTNAWYDSVVHPQITWNVLTGKSSILDGNGNLIQQGYMTPQDNLLTNSDFKSGIINQKGQDTYSLNNDTPTLTVDGWIGIGTVVVIEREQGYLNIYENRGTDDSYLLQKFDNPINGDYTFYINLPYMSSGTLEVYIEGTDQSDKLTISAKGEYTHTFKNTSNGTGLTLHLKGFNGDIYRMKLEKGLYFTGMPVWNEALELQKCLRFYEMKSIVGLAVGGTFQQFLQSTQANYYFPMEGFVTKNKTPTITVLSISSNEGPISNLTATAQGATTNSLSSLVTNNQCDRPFLVFELAIDANDY